MKTLTHEWYPEASIVSKKKITKEMVVKAREEFLANGGEIDYKEYVNPDESKVEGFMRNSGPSECGSGRRILANVPIGYFG